MSSIFAAVMGFPGSVLWGTANYSNTQGQWRSPTPEEIRRMYEHPLQNNIPRTQSGAPIVADVPARTVNEPGLTHP